MAIRTMGHGRKNKCPNDFHHDIMWRRLADRMADIFDRTTTCEMLRLDS
jgi:hypothetical protein